MDIVIESVKLASQLHSRQRKKTPIVPDIPYMGHLMEVAGIVQANGGDETTVAAALLHDAIEDQGAEVRSESETFPKPPWRERKETYIKQVETASVPVLLIMVADKLQNGRSDAASTDPIGAGDEPYNVGEHSPARWGVR